MSDKVYAPFDEEQVKSINSFQREGMMHPFTCGSISEHDGEDILIAFVDGLYCPMCDYTQDWVHDFMANGTWKKTNNLLTDLLKEYGHDSERVN